MSTSVLMVCLGNICRSPLAEGLFRHHVQQHNLTGQYRIDSCGTGGWHVGESPHAGSVAVAEEHGIDITHQRSRQIQTGELGQWDWIIAMDHSNQKNLLRMGAPPEKVRLLLSFIPPGLARDVPDPYYVGGFGQVYNLVDEGCQHLLHFMESHKR
mgnify:CR=1 FL=1